MKYLITSMSTNPRSVYAANPREAVRQVFRTIKRKDDLKQIEHKADLTRFMIVSQKIEVQALELEVNSNDFDKVGYDIDVEDCEKDKCGQCCNGCNDRDCDEPF